MATYACLAKKARQYTGRRVEKVAIGAPASGIDKYLTWLALHLFDGAHTDQSGVHQIGVGLQGHHIAEARTGVRRVTLVPISDFPCDNVGNADS
jgi:hypothetical protein